MAPAPRAMGPPVASSGSGLNSPAAPQSSPTMSITVSSNVGVHSAQSRQIGNGGATLLASKTVAQLAMHKYAHRYKRILFGGSADAGNLDDDEENVWTLEDSCRVLSSELDHRLISRRGQHVDAVRTFLPRILQRTEVNERQGVVMHRCTGCVVFSDASGFTKLTETLAQKADGAEVLSKCLNKFFTPLIDIIEAYRGDVIKFSGDALSILFEATDDYKLTNHPCGSPDEPRKTPFQLACLRGSACCLEIHKRLHNFDTGEGGVRLTLHIGVGAGDITILKVGGEQNRYEYVIAGTPMEQIAVAEPLAESGESVLSPQCWEEIKHTVIEGRKLSEGPPGYHVLAALDTSLHTYPTVKQAAMECTRIESQSKQLIKESEMLKLSGGFIPRAVLKHLRSGNSSSINEMRSVTIIFSQIGGVDVSTERGSKVAQQLMTNMQRACYTHEGNLNKFLVDDKGLLFLFVFGLPPLMHIDDPTRAVAACFEMASALKSMNLVGRFGITTGRVFCGIVGSDRRREYTVMGDTVNLSARLMAKAPENSVLIDQTTYDRCKKDISCQKLEPFMVKGKAVPIQAYAPNSPGIFGLEVMQLGRFLGRLTWGSEHTELPVKLPAGETVKVRMPWRASSQNLGGTSPLLKMTRWRELQQVQQLSMGPLGILKVGGSLSLLGDTGGGKEEVCEYLITEASTAGLFPLFGMMDSRQADQWRAVADLMQNCILALCRGSQTRSGKPSDDEVEQLLRGLVGRDKNMHRFLAFFGFEGFEVPKERRCHMEGESSMAEEVIEAGAAEVCALLVKEVAKQHGIIVVLRLRRGTDLFDGLRGKGTSFWALQERLSTLAMQRQQELTVDSDKPGCHPILLVTVARHKKAGLKLWPGIVAEPRSSGKENPAKYHSIMRPREIHLGELTEDAAVELMCHCLGVSTKHGGSLIKRRLREFVSAVSINIPSYIQECLQHLMIESALVVSDGECNISVPDLNTVNIAEWVQTSMVGGTISRLESLKPAQNHIMKMATIFEGPFSPLDLAAANRVLFGRLPRILAFHDQSKLLCACSSLVEQGFLKEVNIPSHHKPADCAPMRLPRWTISNSLYRKVAGCMLLNSQRVLIKRAVLIERALNVEIPKRIRPGQKGREAGRMSSTGSLGDGKDNFNDVRFDTNNETRPFEPKLAEDDGGAKNMHVLISACALGNARMAMEMLKSPNIDVNKATEIGNYTPLHFAASGGEVEIVHLLCERGAEVEAKSQAQETPVMIAAKRGHLEIVQYLCEWRNALTLENHSSAEFWERVLPEITKEDEIALPLAPSFPLAVQPAAPAAGVVGSAPMNASEVDAAAVAAEARRHEVLSWLTKKLRGIEDVPEEQVVITPDIAGSRGATASTAAPKGDPKSMVGTPEGRASSQSESGGARSQEDGRGGSAQNLSVPPQHHAKKPSCGDSNGSPSRLSPSPLAAGSSVGQGSRFTNGTSFGGRRSWRSALVPSFFKQWGWRTKVRVMLRGKVALFVMLLALAIALFLPDVWVSAGVASSLGADVVLLLVMLLFGAELVLLSVVDSSYPFSFFFFMDCVGTISMISDISFFLGTSADQEQTNRASQEDLTLFRATRTAKIGARAGRLSRLVKVMKFLPGLAVSSRRENIEGEKLQQISNQLTNVLSKRVACLTIIMVIVMPLFTLGAYPEADFSSQVWMDALDRRVIHIQDLYEQGACAEGGCAAEVAGIQDKISEFANFYKGKSYGPYEMCLGEGPAINSFGLQGCRDLSRVAGWTAPDRKQFRMIVSIGALTSAFDYSVPAQAEANMSLALISLVIVLMCGACTLLNYSASELAVRPLERMLSSIKKSAKAIFSSVNAIDATQNDEDFAEDMDGEVALLERVVRKIATLAEISSKTNLFDDATIASMKNEELGVLALTALHAGSVSKTTMSPETHGELRERNRAEISVTMQWQLEEIGLLYEVLNSWDFNVIDMSEKQQAQISAWLLMNNPGSCNYTEHHVDSSKLRNFVDLVAAGYLQNPYHCFSHAVDVTHTVFRYNIMVQSEHFLSMLDQFSLLVASVGHDIGHIGLNNGFLTEVHHELAIRYNDRSPLENMHCCKLFEILGQPDSNVFAGATTEQYREVRKTIIDVILHTDITQHPGLVRELELLFEMHSKTFETASGNAEISEAEVEVLSSPDTKKLVLKSLLHSADISNPTKPWNISREWAHRVLEEYAIQGDQEKQLGIPVQVLNDREKVNAPNSQIGFAEFIITPWWVAKVNVFPSLFESLLTLESNLSAWEQLWLEDSPSEAEKEKMNQRIQRLSSQLRAHSRLSADKPLHVAEPVAKHGNRAWRRTHSAYSARN